MMLLFFFNDTATTEIYTLSLHDALPIFFSAGQARRAAPGLRMPVLSRLYRYNLSPRIESGGERMCLCTHGFRSEEHTSELQSRQYLVCRLLLEKKKIYTHHSYLPFLTCP